MDWISGALSGIGSVISAGINYSNQKEANEINREIAEKNLQFQQQAYKEQFEYQKELNNLQMQREDNAVQRNVMDRMKAGLNPLGATQSASAGMQTASPEAPQMKYQHTAPQIANLGEAVNGAFNVANTSANIGKTQAEKMLIQQQAVESIERANNLKLDTLLKQDQRLETQSREAKNRAEIDKINEERKEVQARIDKINKEMETMTWNLNQSMNMNLRTTDMLDTRVNSVTAWGSKVMNFATAQTEEEIKEYNRQQNNKKKRDQTKDKKGRTHTSEYVNDIYMKGY